MAKEAQSTGYVKGSILTIRQKAWPLSDGEVVVTVRKAHATRSPRQNRWYWGGIMRYMADATGYTIDEIHELCKAKFLPRIVEIPGADNVVAEFTIGGTTTQLNRVEFGEYCEMIREWAATWEPPCLIPDPDQWERLQP